MSREGQERLKAISEKSFGDAAGLSTLPKLRPTGRCACGPGHHNISDSQADGRRRACCLSCYAHWWTDDSGNPLDMDDPFTPYTYTLAAMGEIPSPALPQVPLGLVARITHLNFWETAANPAFGWDGPQRLAAMEAEALSPGVEQRHTSGDPDSLLDFVRHNPFALKQPWVIDQLVAWRVEGGKESRERLRRVLDAYTDSRGRGSAARGELRANIERNLEIYRDVKRISAKRSVQAALMESVHNTGMVEATIREIYEAYERAHQYWLHLPGSKPNQLDAFLSWMRAVADRLPSGNDADQ